MTSVLIVDDEPSIRLMLGEYLRADGFEVLEAVNGTDALHVLTNAPPHQFPDAVLLDLSMPGMSGLDVLAEIRRNFRTAVIVVTARDDEADKVLGLGLGADDYITKPFSPREVTARIRAVLRRGAHPASGEDDGTVPLIFASLVVDISKHEVHVDGDLVELTTREFDVLTALASSPGKVFTRRMLLERVWGSDFFGDDRVVDVHIRNLRRSIRDDAQNPTVVATVRGVGYKFIGHEPT